MEYEIRLRRNTWTEKGGWNWRVFELSNRGEAPVLRDWGWESDQGQALTEANYALDMREEE